MNAKKFKFFKNSLNNKNSISFSYIKFLLSLFFSPKNDGVLIIFSFLLLRPSKSSGALKKDPTFGFLTFGYALKKWALGRACMEKVSCIYRPVTWRNWWDKTSPQIAKWYRGCRKLSILSNVIKTILKSNQILLKLFNCISNTIVAILSPIQATVQGQVLSRALLADWLWWLASPSFGKKWEMQPSFSSNLCQKRFSRAIGTNKVGFHLHHFYVHLHFKTISSLIFTNK